MAQSSPFQYNNENLIFQWQSLCRTIRKSFIYYPHLKIYGVDALGNNIYLSENVVKTKANNNMSPDDQMFAYLNQNILHKRFSTKNL